MPELAIAPLMALPPQTATDQVFDALYSAVISLQLPPGTKVSEAEVARQLNVSRQPVRDAFFRLSKLGFLAIRPQRATLVTRISERAILQAAFVRTALEVECMRLAVRNRSVANLALLRASLAQQARALDSPDRSAFHALDDDYHRILCDIAGHVHAWDLIREQKAHMDRVRYLTLSETRRRSVHAEHTAIVDAIEAGDGPAAIGLLRDHLGQIRTVVHQIRAENTAYFEDSAA